MGARIRREGVSVVRIRFGPSLAPKRIAQRTRCAAQCKRRQGMTARWRVGITRDILDSRGEPSFGRAALATLERESTIAWEYLPEVVGAITPDHAAQYD